MVRTISNQHELRDHNLIYEITRIETSGVVRVSTRWMFG